MRQKESQDIMLAQQLEQVVSNRLGRRHWEFILLTRAWREIVGDRVAANTLPAWIKKDTLWVYVDGSSWMQELTFMKPQILDQVKEHIRSVLLSDIRWLQKSRETMSNAVQEFALPERIVEPEREKNFQYMTQIIGDPGCQQALFHLWQTFQKKMR